ncbi:MAG: hydroxyacid dehydrogenase [Clostridia bacterium]|nr:hydroxyacid dehydrogenase [Clostridia bacterium]
MRAIFLCNRESDVRRVYHADTVTRLQSLCELDDRIYASADLASIPADTEIIFSTWGMPCLTEAQIRAYLPRLQAVFYAAGSVQAFARPLLASGVRVFSAWQANAVPVAEYTLAQILLANKGFFAQARDMKSQRGAPRSTSYLGNYRRCVGLIGCGSIGSLVAKALQHYDLDVYVYDPYLSDARADALGVMRCSLDELFERCSVVSNHLPNNAGTRGMLTYALFSKMLPYATFLNTGRGAQVVEDDLVRALSERPDLTAILDVTDPEPSPAGHPFYTLQNCILTPHIAGSIGNEVWRMSAYMADEFARYQKGEPAQFEVTEGMLATMA